MGVYACGDVCVRACGRTCMCGCVCACMFGVCIGTVSAGLHTENVARGANWEFQKCRGGGQGAYGVLTFQKSRGAITHLGGAKAPSP